MFPSKETIELFEEICKRDGFALTVTSNISKKNPNYKPVLDYLSKIKTLIKESEKEKREIFYESLNLGFLICFHLFRLQIEAENLDIEDYQISIDGLTKYIEYLEEELSKQKKDT